MGFDSGGLAAAAGREDVGVSGGCGLVSLNLICRVISRVTNGR